MKPITLIVALFALGCGEGMNPLIVEQPNIEEFYENLTSEEQQYILEYCNGEMSEHTIKTIVDIPIPAARNSEQDLIRVALKLKYPTLLDAAFEDNLDYVYLQFSKGMYLIQVDSKYKNGRLDERGVIAGDIHSNYGLSTRWEINTAEEILDYVVDVYSKTGAINIPLIPDGLDLTILVIDATGKPLDRELKHLAILLDEAPKASLEQLAEYNQENTPDAYDCVEN